MRVRPEIAHRNREEHFHAVCLLQGEINKRRPRHSRGLYPCVCGKCKRASISLALVGGMYEAIARAAAIDDMDELAWIYGAIEKALNARAYR